MARNVCQDIYSNTAKRDVAYFIKKNVWSVGATLCFHHKLTVDCYVISGSTYVVPNAGIIILFLLVLRCAVVALTLRGCKYVCASSNSPMLKPSI